MLLQGTLSDHLNVAVFQDCCLIVYHPYRPLLQYVQDMGQEDMLLPLAWYDSVPFVLHLLNHVALGVVTQCLLSCLSQANSE